MTELSVKDLERMFRYLMNCCLHDPVWTPADAKRVLCSVWRQYGGWTDCAVPSGDYGDWKGGSDSESFTVAALKDGNFGLLAESEDYTGHGCMCNAATNAYETLASLLRFGVDNDGAREAIRLRLAGYHLPGDQEERT